MLAEGGEERGAMMGVHRQSIHQLACVLTDLCEWVEGWMIIQLHRCRGSTVSATRMTIIAAQWMAALTAPMLPQFATRHTTPITQQVSEHSTAHALSASILEQSRNSPRQSGGGASSLRPLLAAALPALEAKQTTRQQRSPHMQEVPTHSLLCSSCACCAYLVPPAATK